MGADYSFYVKTIETHARAFFKVIIFSIGNVNNKGEIFVSKPFEENKSISKSKYE